MRCGSQVHSSHSRKAVGVKGKPHKLLKAKPVKRVK
jgi:hypothetical protein